MEEWEAFHYFEPFGTPAEDDRARIDYHLFWAANFKNSVPEFLDRDPEETARKRAADEAKMTLADKLKSFFDSLATVSEPSEEAPQDTPEA